MAGSHGTRGILYMVVAIGLLSTMDALVKLLVGQGVHPVQIIAVRGVVILPLLFAIHALKGDTAALRPGRPIAHGLRGLVGFLAPLGFFLGIAYIPLSSAVLVFFSSMFLTTLLSMLVLGERVGVHRWTSIVVGYLGVFLVVHTGLEGQATSVGDAQLKGYLLVLLGSAAYAILFVSGRYLSATETVVSLVLSFNVCVTLAAMLLLPWFWRPLSIAELGMIGVVALFALSGHFCLTKAFALSEASMIVPFEYTALLWSLIYDLLIWDHMPQGNTWIGALVIVGSGLYVLHRERHSATIHKASHKDN